jgi:hypothetical protein
MTASMRPSPITIGWRESVRLPELGIGPITAKIDTGARTAALHAENIAPYTRNNEHRVRFDAYRDDRNNSIARCDEPVHSVKRVKNTSGTVENRYVIETPIALGEHVFSALVTLTGRADMGVSMLIGRATIGSRFLVHPARGFLLTRRPRARSPRP